MVNIQYKTQYETLHKTTETWVN